MDQECISIAKECFTVSTYYFDPYFFLFFRSDGPSTKGALILVILISIQLTHGWHLWYSHIYHQQKKSNGSPLVLVPLPTWWTTNFSPYLMELFKHVYLTMILTPVNPLSLSPLTHMGTPQPCPSSHQPTQICSPGNPSFGPTSPRPVQTCLLCNTHLLASRQLTFNWKTFLWILQIHHNYSERHPQQTLKLTQSNHANTNSILIVSTHSLEPSWILPFWNL